VAGSFKASSMSFASPVTRYYSINPAIFTPKQRLSYDDNAYFMKDYDTGYLKNENNEGQVYLASISLPHGAKITGATMYSQHFVVSQQIYFNLYNVNFTGTSTEIFTLGKTGVSNGYQSESVSGLNHTVNNQNYSYMLYLYLGGYPKFCGAVITYTIDSPLP